MGIVENIKNNNPNTASVKFRGHQSKGTWRKLRDAMTENRTVKSLDLSSTDIASFEPEKYFAALIAKIHHNPHSCLQELYLDNNALSNAHIESLSSWLSDYGRLHTLSLVNNKIADGWLGTLCTSLIKAITNKGSILARLNLKDNHIRQQGTDYLINLAKKNSHVAEINLDGNEQIPSVAIEQLQITLDQNKEHKYFQCLKAIENDDFAIFMDWIHGVDLNCTDVHGNTLISIASKHGRIRFVKILLQLKANCNIPDHTGRIALHWAVYAPKNVKEIMIELEKAGAVLDHRDYNGRTPLHEAAVKRNCEAITILADRFNVSLVLEDFQRKTPFDLVGGNEPLSIQARALFNQIKQAKSIKLSQPEFRNLIFQGGGPKGAVYLGALEEAINLDIIQMEDILRVGGTSIGAIFALFIGLGYTVEEIKQRVDKLNLEDFLQEDDSKLFATLKNVENALINLKGNLSQESSSYIKRKSKEFFMTVLKRHFEKYFERLSKQDITWGCEMRQLSDMQILLTAISLTTNLNQDMTPIVRALPASIQALQTQKGGLFSGKSVVRWLKEVIHEKTGNSDITFGELQNMRARQNQEAANSSSLKELFFVGTNISTGTAETFSAETTEDMPIYEAIRISMSIPFIFAPYKIERTPTEHSSEPQSVQKKEEHYFVDGGILENFPLDLFDKPKYRMGIHDEPGYNRFRYNPQTLGFRIVSKPLEEEGNSTKEEDNSMLANLFERFGLSPLFEVSKAVYNHESNKLARLQYNNNRVINIFDGGISLIQTLDPDLKKRLIQNGVDGVQKFQEERNNRQTPQFLPEGHLKSKL